MYSVYFKATIYEEGSGEDGDYGHDSRLHGVITGVSSFKDAMERSENEFGDTLEKVSIELFDTSMMTFPSEKGEEIHKILEGNAF